MPDDIIITDEKTLLKDEVDSLKKRINSLRRDRDGALVQINQMLEQSAGDKRILNAVTEDNIRVKKQLAEAKRRYRQDLYALRREIEKREMAAGIIGGVIGLVCTAIIVIIYYLTRYRVF